jgi:predicted dithiol-disulfide oxidoreductase (DUF899 family)
MTNHPIVSREKWLEARRALLAKEKQLTRQHDQLARERRDLPWVRVEKQYAFDTPRGKATLADLFAGPSCSYVCDHIDGAVPHLAARDVTLTMTSRAPLAKLEAFKNRMGWQFPWVSSFGSDFNYDFHVSFKPQDWKDGKIDYNYKMQPFPGNEAPGASVFYKDPATGEIFHTYSTYGRGLDSFVGTYTLLDLVPKGRDEDQLPFDMAWVRYHDRYGTSLDTGFADPDKPYWPKFESTPAATASPNSPGCCHGSEGAH